MSELPSEIRAKPAVLVGIAGLEITNFVHRSIWDAFNNRRPDGSSVQFKLLKNNHEFPTVKPKRNSYDWYVPKGILKRNWMNKYLNEVPSLVVVFYELEWNDSMWNEKKIECASRVQSLRAMLEGRSTKIAVVLIQKSAQPPPGAEDVGATERASILCSACELAAKNLYVLPHGDHLSGYVFRLENAFYDLGQSFYHSEYRIVKSHREQLNKTTHQYLFVRHQFKMGFLNEFKPDRALAHKHYLQAYNNLMDIKMVDTNLMEIKTVASFINYKLCKLMFNSKCPKDAITQFKNHIERFKNRTGPKELIFEHHAWLASQYSTFAELFDEAIKQGLSAMQTQHPGYFFHSASKQAILRRQACYNLCKDVTSYPQIDPLAGEEKLEFYGQRAWRPGKLSAEPADVAKEAIAIQALQYREKMVNHSLLITSLLGNAISQFKIYKCLRMRRFLVVQMAEEYFNIKDYGKVLTLLMHMLWNYPGEKWPLLLTDILKTALKAAFLSSSVQDYLTLALQSLGPSTLFSENRQVEIFQNIDNILKGKPPNPELEISNYSTNEVLNNWNMKLNSTEPIIFTIDENNPMFFVEAKARFTEQKYSANSIATVEVFIKNSFHGNIEFSNISVTINSMGVNTENVVIDSARNDFSFQGKEIRKFEFRFQVAPPNDNNNEIHLSMVSLYLGNIEKCCVILRFPSLGVDANLEHGFFSEIQPIRRNSFDKVKSLTSTQVFEKECNFDVKIDSKKPALIGEWFPIKIRLSAKENISNVILSTMVFVDGNNDPSTELSTNTREKISNVIMEVGNIDENEFSQKTIFIRAHKVGERNVHVKVEFLRSKQRKGYKDVFYLLPFVKPFEVTTRFFSMLYEPLTKGFVHEPIFVMPHIVCISPWKIKILNTCVELSNAIKIKSKISEKSILSGIILNEDESATDIYCVVPTAKNEQSTSTGIFTIQWIREDEEAIETSSSVILTALYVEDAPISVEAKLPACGWVRTPFCAAYFIHNHSQYLITLRLTVEGSDAFLFAGHKQIELSVLPESEKKVEWVLLPLIAGFVALPSVSLIAISEDEGKISKNVLEEVLEKSLPSHIYIMPKSRTSEDF